MRVKRVCRTSGLAAMALGIVCGGATAKAPGEGPESSATARERLIALVEQMQELEAGIEAGDAAALALFEAYDVAARQALAALDPADLPATPPADIDEPKASERGEAPRVDGGAADEGGIAGEPPAEMPPGCTNTGTWIQLGNSTDVAIPTTANTPVTSTITVGAQTRHFINQVIVIVNISHVLSSHLEMTLTSPQGTVVTLTTDNGVGANNFTSATFNDLVDPGGQVPYTSNANLASDHPYADGVNASPLVPEEGLDAFVGEDAVGTWTLTINDDIAGTGGTLLGWTLQVAVTDTPGYSTTRTFGVSPAVAIPTGPSTTDSSVAVSGMGPYICDVDVFVDIDHTNCGDLDMTVTSPAGTVITLSTDNGVGDNNFAGTVFDNQVDPDGSLPYSANQQMATERVFGNNILAARLTPEESLGALRGQNPNGAWMLRISDDLANNGGTLNSWAVTITTCSCSEPCSGDVNNDGAVDINDYTLIILGWGGC